MPHHNEGSTLVLDTLTLTPGDLFDLDTLSDPGIPARGRLWAGIGHAGLGLPEASNTGNNTGGHQGGNSQYENPRPERYEGSKGNNSGSSTSKSGK